jgi:hypothetical protein
MRIGGTDCDAAYFCPNEGDCTMPPAYLAGFRKEEERTNSVLTHEDIRRAADFAAASGNRIMFCLNMGPGPRDPKSGAWQTENARQLIRYAKSLPQGDRFQIWEAGNEVNVMSFNYRLPKFLIPQQFAADLRRLRDVIDSESPGAKLAAPSDYFVPLATVGDLQFTARLLPLARPLIDLVTWHLYATQSERCPYPHPSSQRTLFDASIKAMNRGFARYVKAAAGNLPVVNGESASAQCGGQVGVSDTLLDALWYADWIGMMSEAGSSGVIRQTLVGSDYGLLDPVSYQPRPTFLALVLLKRQIARYHLKTSTNQPDILAHAFCASSGDGALTVVIANPQPVARPIEISLNGQDIRSAEQWQLSANGDLGATSASINGEFARDDGQIPNPAGMPMTVENGRVKLTLAPHVLLFVRLIPVGSVVRCQW